MLMRKPSQAIGVEASGGVLHAVLAAREGSSVRFVDSVEVRMPRPTGEASRVLRGLVEKKGWHGLPVAIGLGGDAVFFRTAELAADDARSPDQVICGQVADFMGLAEGETLRDAAVTRQRDGTRRLFYAVARRDPVLAEIEAADEAGLRVLDVVPSAVALYAAASHFLRLRGGTLACVDVRDDGTEVVIGRGTELLLARRFPLGRAASGLAGGGDPASAESWRRELTSCLSFYRTQGAGMPEPELLVLAGLTGEHAGAAQTVGEATGLRTMLLAAADATVIPSALARMTAAAAVALAGLELAPPRLSLLPDDLKEARALARQLPHWALAAAAVPLALALLATGSYLQRAGLRRAHADLARLVTDQQSLQRQDQAIRAARERYGPDVEAWGTLAAGGPTARSLLQALAEAKHSNDWIVLVADADSYVAATNSVLDTAAAARNAEKPPGLRRFVAEGYTPVADLSTVRAMISRLRQHPRIEACDLLPDDKLRPAPARDVRWADGGGHLFALELGVRAP